MIEIGANEELMAGLGRTIDCCNKGAAIPLTITALGCLTSKISLSCCFMTWISSVICGYSINYKKMNPIIEYKNLFAKRTRLYDLLNELNDSNKE